MRDSVDYYVQNWGKVVLMVRSERNRLLARDLKLFNPCSMPSFQAKSDGKA
jgi:hypothetical protein